MIESRQNETLKAIRRLRRRQADEAVLEGPHLLAAALAARVELDIVLATPEFAASAAGRELVARLARPPRLASPAALDDLFDSDSPRGVLAVARLHRRGAETLPLDSNGTYLYLDGVQDPGNLGAIVRVAQAFGVAAVALAPGCAHPNHPRALRASAGSLLSLPVALQVVPEALDRHLQPLAPSWVALEAHGGEPFPIPRPAGCLVIACGAEGRGISAALATRVQRPWTIPLASGVESLNVAVAVGVVLFALRGSA